jgi:hypothetical membrane protein
VVVSVGAVITLVWYILGWAIAGALLEGYDPVEQAISELFAIGAPTGPRAIVVSGLVASGIGLLAFAFAVHHGLPGRSRTGPAMIAISGICTVTIVVAPCTEGCPGFGATPTDTAHTIIAGLGYGLLVTAPFAIAWRTRHAEPGLARWSVVTASVALALFAIHQWVPVDEAAGLLQRTFNTVADVWYVLAAAVIVQRWRSATGDDHDGSSPERGSSGPQRP